MSPVIKMIIIVILQQTMYVWFATHIHGHWAWLDLFITRLNCNNIKLVFVADGLSDHHTVVIDLSSKFVLEPSKQCMTFWPINNINIDNLRKDLEHADPLINPKSTLCELLNQYYVAFLTNMPQNKQKFVHWHLGCH